MCSLLSFLTSKAGSASSQEIISYIGKELYGFEALLVKETLVRIAKLKHGVWSLRREYGTR
jgi:hypothetical protein